MSFAVDIGTGSAVELLAVRTYAPESDPQEQPLKLARDKMYDLADSLADRNQLDGLLEHVYEKWPVEGKPTDVDGRLTWPIAWGDLQPFFDGADVDDILDDKEETKVKVLRLEDHDTIRAMLSSYGWSTAITWPQIQKVFRIALQENMQYPISKFQMLRANMSLMIKRSQFTKKVRDMGRDKILAFCWQIYSTWDLSKEPVEVDYDGAKKLTWPLPFEGKEGSVSSLFIACGWEAESGIPQLEEALFKEGNTRLREVLGTDKGPGAVCWPDVQQCFREAAKEAEGMTEWNVHMNDLYPVLNKLVTLRQRIQKTDIAALLMGEWRMFCISEKDRGNLDKGFSYGIVLSDYDAEKMTFKGASKKQGKYVIEDGQVMVDETNGRVKIQYTEKWPHGVTDKISATLKSNAKFHCETTGGYIQKARRADTLPETPEERLERDSAKDGLSTGKYFDNDKDVHAANSTAPAASSAAAPTPAAKPAPKPAASAS